MSTPPIEFTLALLAQATSPAVSPEVELLKSQLEFVLRLNSVFLGFLALLGGLLTWFFKSNLDDAREMATRMVRQELSDHIEPLIKAEARNIQRTFRTEQIISNTVVDYYVPARPGKEPLEYGLLKGRGFLDVRLWHLGQKPQGRLGSVLVIDFVNCDVLAVPEIASPDGAVREVGYKKRDALVNEVIQALIDLRIGRPILVVYVRPGQGRIGAIDLLSQTFPEDVRYYSSANTPVALMGAAIDSAYVAYSDRQVAT
ncbi:hypothetical protein IQ254_16830 [Nodosilinea sp. LEGE 07088]|uniref:hypothetical protein n=1 Tax=Nodosilinea sp. LEGE 07088 TaxID=2777968 RepID=UPI00187F1979|nr:hypothetical protein [Nodosilinea sp. LEGE 07088]MBE9138839.1 hypothetical protein [Nodosilinea sp. LEGE 07088]